MYDAITSFANNSQLEATKPIDQPGKSLKSHPDASVIRSLGAAHFIGSI
jgi:hypothetical protein